MEDIISRLITKWEKEYLGRGPLQVKTSILEHAVIVVLRGF
nr:Na-translocating system protein MpsC family protein [Metabacillus flavus]